jgi:branched-chain amino acid transport system ATP-binding protein
MSLSITGVRASYGQTQVLFGVDVEVRAGEIAGIFGHNGAGKSTLLRVIAGLHPKATYEARLFGQRFDHLPPQSVARMGILLVREGAHVFEGLTVQEHLLLGARLGRISGRGTRELDEIFTLFPILAEFRRRSASQLSGGQRQALALGTAFISNPACLLLDEPSTGLSVLALEVVYEALEKFKSAGLPLLVAEQNPEWLSRIADRAYLLEVGRVDAQGSANKLLRPAAQAAGLT